MEHMEATTTHTATDRYFEAPIDELGTEFAAHPEGSVERELLGNILNARMDFDSAVKDVTKLSDRVADDLDSIRRALENGRGLNTLGELHAAGPALNVAIAVREERAKALRRAIALAEKLGAIEA